MSDRTSRWREGRKRRTLDELHGRPRGLASRKRITDHLDSLVAMGFSWGAIMSAAGMRSSTPAYAYARGTENTYMLHGRVYLELTPEAIFDRAAPDCKVASFAARRRYQALQWMGWPQAVIEATAVELTGNHAWCNMLLPDERIAAKRHRAMRAAFDALSMRQGPSRHTAAMARTKGFLPPLAWDNIDDPNEQPSVDAPAPDDTSDIDMIAVDRVLAGEWAQLTSQEVYEVIRRGAARGLDSGDMAGLLRMSHDAVSRRASRAGIRTSINNDKRRVAA